MSPTRRTTSRTHGVTWKYVLAALLQCLYAPCVHGDGRGPAAQGRLVRSERSRATALAVDGQGGFEPWAADVEGDDASPGIEAEEAVKVATSSDGGARALASLSEVHGAAHEASGSVGRAEAVIANTTASAESSTTLATTSQATTSQASTSQASTSQASTSQATTSQTSTEAVADNTTAAPASTTVPATTSQATVANTTAPPDSSTNPPTTSQATTSPAASTSAETTSPTEATTSPAAATSPAATTAPAGGNHTGPPGNASNNSRKAEPPHGKGLVNQRKLLALNSTIVVESLLFAKEMIALERKKKCPEKIAELELTPQTAQVQMSADAAVILTVAVRGLTVGIEVEWTPDNRDDTQDRHIALAQVEKELVRMGGYLGLIDAGAKLILPKPACRLVPNISSSTDEAAAFAIGQAELHGPPEQLVGPGPFSLPSPPALGLLVDKELEAYKRGLASQEGSAADARRMCGRVGGCRSGPFPDSFTWLTSKPDCMDYVHDQEDCGACYMFAAIDSLSDRHCINFDAKSMLGEVNQLSLQQTLVCEPQGQMCAGGWADIPFNHTVSVGINTEQSWEYARSCLPDHECAFGNTCLTKYASMCPLFFSLKERSKIRVFEDAYMVVKKKCETTAQPAACAGWAKSFFNNESNSEVFSPAKAFCDECRDKFAGFNEPRAAPSLLELELDEEEEEELAKAGASRDKIWPWDWFTRRRRMATTTEAPSSSLNVTTTEGIVGIVAEENCDRERCAVEPKVYFITSYHYLWNTEEAFKTELYNEGPFYTSFWIYEDFTWFFQNYPTDGYHHFFGEQLGGHAVTMIGWVDCVRHTTSSSFLSLGQGSSTGQALDDAARLQHKAQRRSQALRRYERKATTSKCWHMRNSWGGQWADDGYFRMSVDMLTGAEGTNIHIASAAGDQPFSVS